MDARRGTRSWLAASAHDHPSDGWNQGTVWPGYYFTRVLQQSHAGGDGCVATLRTQPSVLRRLQRPQVRGSRQGAGGQACANTSAPVAVIQPEFDSPRSCRRGLVPRTGCQLGQQAPVHMGRPAPGQGPAQVAGHRGSLGHPAQRRGGGGVGILPVAPGQQRLLQRQSPRQGAGRPLAMLPRTPRVVGGCQASARLHHACKPCPAAAPSRPRAAEVRLTFTEHASG